MKQPADDRRGLRVALEDAARRGALSLAVPDARTLLAAAADEPAPLLVARVCRAIRGLARQLHEADDSVSADALTSVVTRLEEAAYSQDGALLQSAMTWAAATLQAAAIDTPALDHPTRLELAQGFATPAEPREAAPRPAAARTSERSIGVDVVDVAEDRFTLGDTALSYGNNDRNAPLYFRAGRGTSKEARLLLFALTGDDAHLGKNDDMGPDTQSRVRMMLQRASDGRVALVGSRFSGRDKFRVTGATLGPRLCTLLASAAK